MSINYTGVGTLTITGADAALYKIDTVGQTLPCLVPTYTTYTAGAAPTNQPLTAKTVGSTSTLGVYDGLGFSVTETVTYTHGFTIAQDSRDNSTAGQNVQLINARGAATFDDNIVMRDGSYNPTPIYTSGRTWWLANDVGDPDPTFLSGSTPGVPSSFHWINLVPEHPGNVTIGSLDFFGATGVNGLGLALEMQEYLHFAPGINWYYPGNGAHDVSTTFMIDGRNQVAAMWVDSNTFISNSSDAQCSGTTLPTCVDPSQFGNVFSAIQIPSGLRGSHDTPAGSNVYVTNNHCLGVYTCINLNSGNGDYVIGNDIEQPWEDALHITQTDNLLVQWNFIHNFRAGPAHGDNAQLPWSNAIVQAYGPITYSDNFIATGRGGGDGDGTGYYDGNNFLFSGTPSGITFSTMIYHGNTVFNSAGNGARPNAMATASFDYNAWIRDQSGQATNSSAVNPAMIFDGPDGTNISVKMQCNVTMQAAFYTVATATDPHPTETVNGVQSNINLQATGYTAAFTGPLLTSKPAVGPTLAQYQAMLVPKSGSVLDTVNTSGGCKPGPNWGASNGIDYVNRIDNTAPVSP